MASQPEPEPEPEPEQQARPEPIPEPEPWLGVEGVDPNHPADRDETLSVGEGGKPSAPRMPAMVIWVWRYSSKCPDEPLKWRHYNSLVQLARHYFGDQINQHFICLDGVDAMRHPKRKQSNP